MRPPVVPSRIVVSSIVLLALLAAVPVGEAQFPGAAEYHIEIKVENDPQPVMPITEERLVRADVSIACAAPGIDPSLRPKQLDLYVMTHVPWAVATVSPSTHYVDMTPEQCAQGHTTDFPVQVAITFTKDAPAFAITRFDLRVKLDDIERAAEFTLRPGFYERYQARFEQTIFKASQNDLLQVPLTIENFGNGPVMIRVRLAEGSSPSLNVALPGLQAVPSAIAGGETSRLTIPIDVQTPLRNEQGQLILLVDGHSADDTSLVLSPTQVTAVVVTEGAADPDFDVGEAPGLGGLFLPLTAALVAFFVRRRI